MLSGTRSIQVGSKQEKIEGGGQEMKASKFNILVDQEGKEEMIVYNSLYGSLSLWEGYEIEAVKALLDDPNDNRNGNEDIRQNLIEQQNIIDDWFDEKKIIEERKLKGMNDANRLDLVLLPTLACNFSCVYCYESHEASKMKETTQAAILSWLEREIPKRKVTMLHWFGGEPLLAYRTIVSMTRHVMDLAADSGHYVTPHITTNGYLLNPKRCRELTEIGIKNFQITLDGTPETHDRLRVLRNGKGTFDQIFNNIKVLAASDRQAKISLRINFNHNNLHTIPTLLEMFPEEIRSQLRVVYEPIFGQCAVSATDNLPAREISASIADYYKLAEELGYDVILGQSCLYTGRLVYCYAERKNQMIINYNADVYKCSVGNFDPKERVGYIHPDGFFVKDDDQWNNWVGMDVFEEECHECVYLPLCMGGCRKARQQNKDTGNYCSLVPTNTINILKHVAYGSFEGLLLREEAGST